MNADPAQAESPRGAVGVDGRRRAILVVSAQIIVNLLKPGEHHYAVIGNALPEDARVVGAEYDALHDHWRVAVESETFDPVADYERLPELPSVVMVLGREAQP